MGRVLGGGGKEQKGKRTHGHGHQCGDWCGEGGIRGLNGNGKNTGKIKLKYISWKYKPTLLFSVNIILFWRILLIL